MEVTKQRIYWIDLCRLFIIITVAINHVPPKLGEIFHDWNHYLVITPSFFLSGYCFNSAASKLLSDYFSRKCRTLLRPTLCFFFFFYILWLLGGKALANDDSIAWYTPLIELATGQLDTIIAPMWYVIALFVIQPLYFILREHLPANWLFPVCLVTGCVSSVLPIPHFWEFHQALLYLPVYALGAAYRRNNEVFERIPFAAVILLCIVGIVLFTVLEYDSTPYLLALSPFIMVFTYAWVRVIITGAEWIDRNCTHYQWISDMGGNTIILLAVHCYVIGVTKVLVDHLLQTEGYLEGHPFYKIPIGLFSIFSLYPLVIFILRYVPWILGKKKKV
ncbi:MAG: hypothetical protein IKP81_04585 [Paludibacteraceae bacterium]|nr:hypothetical protein [Paludibacteraceae bacterium]